jgi:hypothetical protein
MRKKHKQERARQKELAAKVEKKKRGDSKIGLLENERIVLVGRPARSAKLGRYLLTLGLYGVWRKRNTFVLTDRRVLIGKGLFNRTEQSIPFRRVDDARYRRRGFAGYTELRFKDRHGEESERIGPLTPSRAKRFTNGVLDRL